MKLFHSPASPFVRKVMVIAHETGQLDALELVAAAGSPVDPGTMPVADNPLGKLPTLIDDQGRALFDSRVITRFLAARAGALARFYSEGDSQWSIATLEALADGILDAAILMVYEVRCRPEERRHAPWVEAQWAKITRALDALERDRIAHLERVAEAPDAGAIAAGCALGYLDFRHAARDWRAGRPRLAAWFTALGRRPSFAATVPQG